VTGAELKVVAADSDVVGGKKAGFILVEELWLFGKKPHARRRCCAKRLGGMVSRSEGFVIFLTTHSDEPPAGEFKDKLDYARDVRDGVIEDKTFWPVLYEWPRGDARGRGVSRPGNFYVTNPNARPIGQRGMARPS
jgi:phage terminase large subunit-like protein